MAEIAAPTRPINQMINSSIATTMPNFRTTLMLDGKPYETLQDILPTEPRALDILFIAKTPATGSVAAGHYFQGKQGKMFWNALSRYGILQMQADRYEDENLLDNNFGMTDIVKVPRDYGDEPSPAEYKAGMMRILAIIEKYRPLIVVFVYKGVLDSLLKLQFKRTDKSVYGFNPLLEGLFNARLFVFPMPGTPCTTSQAQTAMSDLKRALNR